MRLFTIVLILAFSGVANADSEPSLDQTFRTMALLAKFSAVESAGSKGSYGLNVGLGVTDVGDLSDSGHASGIVGATERSTDSSTPSRWLRVTLSHGTEWPMDFGISVGQLHGTSTQQLAGFIQATLFESLGWPAATVRYHYAQLMGLRSGAAASSSGVELVASQGIWRYFSGYVAAGIDRSDILLTGGDEDDQFSLNRDGKWSETQQIQSSYGKVGLNIATWSAFLGLIGEGQVDQDENVTLSAKLNWLI